MRESLLQLYPAAYRTAHGQEIVDVHRELTEGLPRAARLRADADLVAHALRVRLRLDSASPAGRLFVLAAPFALAVGAVNSGIHLMTWYTGIALSPGSVWSHLSTTDGMWALHVLLLAMVCVGAIIALSGRWALGAGLAVGGLLGIAVQWTIAAPQYGEGAFEPVAAVLTAFVVLACPPDRRGDRRLAAAAGAMAAVAWFPVALIDTRAFVVSTEYGAWPLLVLAATGAVLALHGRSSGLREMGAMALASPLFLAYAYTSGWLELPPVLAIGVALALPILAGLTAAYHRLWQ
ncbi:hypothetical protein OG394_20070 [Kribbella sp. NBC_01245]|uniref:hypothetical protein n=1 Tax=Kribbella sp. NBC_01245 TaxID=2903578 RepID=UPI002E2A54FE|nr:hypothetical protein [Kribbella sp. NBC_01245]